MSVFESDDEDSIELFSLDEENADKELTLDSEGEENVNPNASSGSKMKSSKSQRGLDPRIARNPSRRHLVSNTWQIAVLIVNMTQDPFIFMLAYTWIRFL